LTVRATLLAITVGMLAAVFVFLALVGSNPVWPGAPGDPDAEGRVRLCGYDTLRYKLAIWTLAAVIGGTPALFTYPGRIINPGEMSPANAIEIAVSTVVVVVARLSWTDPRRLAG
jgi:ABC-type branched-subunit amino acid transport system permease subunit